MEPPTPHSPQEPQDPKKLVPPVGVCPQHPEAYLIEDSVCMECGLVVLEANIWAPEDTLPHAPLANDNPFTWEVFELIETLGEAAHFYPSIIEGAKKFFLEKREVLKNLKREKCRVFQVDSHGRVAGIVKKDSKIRKKGMKKGSKKESELTEVELLEYRDLNSRRAKICLYAACRLEGVPRTIDEFCKELWDRVEAWEFDFEEEMEQWLSDTKINLPLVRAQQYIPRFVWALGLPYEVEKYALRLAAEAEVKLSNRTADVLAAVAIHVAAEKVAGQRKNTSSNNVRVVDRLREVGNPRKVSADEISSVLPVSASSIYAVKKEFKAKNIE